MTLPVLGIDVAKLKFNLCLIGQGGKLRHRVFANNEAGFIQLSQWLVKNHTARVHGCLEATGTCHETRFSDRDAHDGVKQTLGRRALRPR